MDFLLVVFTIILRILNIILYPFLLYVPKKNRRSVSPPTDGLLMVSATELSKLIRERKISCVEITELYVRRIKEVNPLLNAVVEERFEDALKEAKNVDDYLRTTSLSEDELKKIKPLLGVPVTIKEALSVSGMSSVAGSLTRLGMKADIDGDAVNRLKVSGAIPLLVSNTPELSIGWYCSNLVTGTTCNPYDLTRNSGASSGGECALLGAGASLLGMGSDIGGSIRYPAMCCGVFGHKPSARVVPVKGHIPLPDNKKVNDYMGIGPLTRYAEDLKLALTVLAGKQSIDLRLHEKVNLNGLRVFYMEEAPQSFINPPVQTEIKEAITKSVRFLENKYHTKTVHKGSFEEYFLDSFEVSTSLLRELQGVPNLLKSENSSIIVELMKSLFGQSKLSFGFLLTSFLNGFQNFQEEHQIKNDELKEHLLKELGNDGVLLYPTFHCSALKHGEFFFNLPGILYMLPFNILGLPATSVPCGLDSDGLPIGIQVIAAPNQDRLCLAVAEALEKCFGGWLPPQKRE